MPLVAILATAACASTARIPTSDLSTTPGGHAGVRLVYSARIEGTDGRRGTVRLAAAVAPPERLRLEVLGPTGGTRLVLATDGVRAVAMVVPERRFDTAAATPEALATWTGLPLGPAALVALLAGRAPCLETTAAVDGRPGSDPCPDLRFQPAVAGSGDGEACNGSLHARSGGRLLATIACAGSGPGGWPERIGVQMSSGGRSIELRRTDGPAAGPLSDALFAPAIPAGFQQVDLLTGIDTGSLLEGIDEDGP